MKLSERRQRAQEGSLRQPGRQLSATPITIPAANGNGQSLWGSPAEHRQGKQEIRECSEWMAQVSGPLASGEPLAMQKPWRGIADEGQHCVSPQPWPRPFFIFYAHAYICWLYPDLWIQQGLQRNICFWHQFLPRCRLVVFLTLWGPLARPWISWCNLQRWEGLRELNKAMCCLWENLQMLYILQKKLKNKSK